MQKKIIGLFALTTLLAACQPEMPAATFESAGLRALQEQNGNDMRFLQHWAERNNPIAQRELALVYATQSGQEKQAIHWLQKAAEAGNHQAQFYLAEANYQPKLGLKQNYEAAWRWYLAAARENNKAGLMLARMAKYGQGVDKNLALSLQWLKQASQQGNAQAMFLLSNAYAAGEGVNRDTSRADYWLHLAAENDYPVALQQLAMQLSGSNKPEDQARAADLFKEASDERLLQWNHYQ